MYNNVIYWLFNFSALIYLFLCSYDTKSILCDYHTLHIIKKLLLCLYFYFFIFLFPLSCCLQHFLYCLGNLLFFISLPLSNIYLLSSFIAILILFFLLLAELLDSATFDQAFLLEQSQFIGSRALWTGPILMEGFLLIHSGFNLY